jgi:hypothetical protein
MDENFLDEFEQIKGFRDMGKMAISIYEGIVADNSVIIYSEHSYKMLTSIMAAIFSAKFEQPEEDSE